MSQATPEPESPEPETGAELVSVEVVQPALRQMPDEPDYEFAPVNEVEEANIVALRKQIAAHDDRLPPLVLTSDDNRERRYSLRDLMLLITISAVLLAGFRLLNPGWYAMGLGLVVFASRVVIDLMRIESSFIRVAWWVLSTIYLTACVYAAIATSVGA